MYCVHNRQVGKVLKICTQVQVLLHCYYSITSKSTGVREPLK